MFPDGGTTASNSTGPPSQPDPAGEPADCVTGSSSRRLVTGPAGNAGAAVSVGGKPDRQHLPLILRERCEPIGWNRRLLGIQPLMRTVGVVSDHPRIQRFLSRGEARERPMLVEEVGP